MKSTMRAVTVLMAGILAGWIGHSFYLARQASRLDNIYMENRRASLELPFINPLLECEMGESVMLKPLQTAKQDVAALIEGWKQDDTSLSVAVYYRNLNDGPTFGINEKERFLPGSLLKVPTLMGFLKEVEQNPGILRKVVRNELDERALPFQSIAPQERLVRGRSYTIEQLLGRMIRYSDNGATSLLNERGGLRMMERVYSDLGLSREEVITIKQYTSFFRMLYNASYLDKKYSNYALSLLAQSEFKAGLAAGLPSSVTIAHKFGEQAYRTDLATEKYDWAQLHDCGIIYYPQNPYLLCVMTRGKRLEHLAPVIADISKLVYKNVDRQMRATGHFIEH